jgi:Arm DNA-binding domain
MVPEMPGPQNRLTDRTLRTLKIVPQTACDLPDGGDLYVRAEPSGSKVFWLRYQFDGRRRRWVLGHYGEAGLSLAEAREKRDGAQGLLRQGVDPFALDQEQKQGQKRALEAAKLAELEVERREVWTVASADRAVLRARTASGSCGSGLGDGCVSRSVWLALKLLLVIGRRRGEVIRAQAVGVRSARRALLDPGRAPRQEKGSGWRDAASGSAFCPGHEHREGAFRAEPDSPRLLPSPDGALDCRASG